MVTSHLSEETLKEIRSELYDWSAELADIAQHTITESESGQSLKRKMERVERLIDELDRVLVK